MRSGRTRARSKGVPYRSRRERDERLSAIRTSSKKERPRRQLIGVIVSILAAAISAVSAYVALSSYRSQQNASIMAMADQVVLVAPPVSTAQLNQVKKLHSGDYIDYLPMYVENYGRLPILGLNVKATVNDKVEQSQDIGTLLPCTEIDVSNILGTALSRASGPPSWNVTIYFQDVFGQSWQRQLNSAPVPVANPSKHLVLREGSGIVTDVMKNCTAA